MEPNVSIPMTLGKGRRRVRDDTVDATQIRSVFLLSCAVVQRPVAIHDTNRRESTRRQIHLPPSFSKCLLLSDTGLLPYSGYLSCMDEPVARKGPQAKSDVPKYVCYFCLLLHRDSDSLTYMDRSVVQEPSVKVI